MPMEAFMERSSKDGRGSLLEVEGERPWLGDKFGDEEGKGDVLVEGSIGEVESLGDRYVVIVDVALILWPISSEDNVGH